jgi:hypothetical protein
MRILLFVRVHESDFGMILLQKSENRTTLKVSQQLSIHARAGTAPASLRPWKRAVGIAVRNFGAHPQASDISQHEPRHPRGLS